MEDIMVTVTSFITENINVVVTTMIVIILAISYMIYQKKEALNQKHTNWKVRCLKIQKLFNQAIERHKTYHSREVTPQDITKIKADVDRHSDFNSFISNLNIDFLHHRLIDFAQDDKLIDSLSHFVDDLNDRIRNKFHLPGHIVRVGSCRDGSKVGRVNEMDTLYVINTNFRASKINENNCYHIFLENGTQLIPSKLTPELADAIETTGIRYGGGPLEHGGFNAPQYSGVRYNGPAVTVLFRYQSDTQPRPIDISIDVVMAFQLPQDSPIRKSVEHKMSVIQNENRDKIIAKGGIHFIPDFVNDAWLVTTAELEAELFNSLSKLSPVKQAYRYNKIISHDINSMHSTFDVPKVEDMDYISQSLDSVKHGTVQQDELTYLKMCMRYAHSFLSIDGASRHKELGKPDASIITAALKQTILTEGMKNPQYFSESQTLEDDVYDLCMKAFEFIGNLEHPYFVPHALLEGVKISVFSLSKTVLLTEERAILEYSMQEKCRRVCSKIKPKVLTEPDEQVIDQSTNAVVDLQQYLVPEVDSPEYAYRVFLDPSISPKRCPVVYHAKQIINALQNTCDGVVTINVSNQCIYSSVKTIDYWKQSFEEELRLIHDEMIEVNTNETSFEQTGIIVQLRVISSMNTVVFTQTENYPNGVYYTVHDEGFIVRNEKTETDEECMQSSEDETIRTDGERTSQNVQLTDEPHHAGETLSRSSTFKRNHVLSYKEGKDIPNEYENVKPAYLRKSARNMRIFQEDDPVNFTPSREDIQTKTAKMNIVIQYIDEFCIKHDKKGFATAAESFTSWFDHQVDLIKISCPEDHVMDIMLVVTGPTIHVHTVFTRKGSTIEEQQKAHYTNQVCRLLKKKVNLNLKSGSESDKFVHVEAVSHFLECESRIHCTSEERPSSANLEEVKEVLMTLMLQKDTIFKDRIGNEINIQLTEQQINTIFKFELGSHNIIEGPPGSGKTILEQVICEKRGKTKCALISPNKAMVAWLEYQGKAETWWAKNGHEILHLLMSELQNRHYIIIDDVQYVDCDKETWGRIFENIRTPDQHLYLFMDSKYQLYKGKESDKIMKELKYLVVDYDGYIIAPLKDIHRNSKVVVNYMEATASTGKESKNFGSRNQLVGDDIKITHIPYMTESFARNGTIQYIKDIIGSDPLKAKYQPRDFAILFHNSERKRVFFEDDTLDIIEDTINTFKHFWPESRPQRADKYPVNGVVIDSLENFLGLEATVLFFVIHDNFEMDDARLKTTIASRGIQRVEFLKEEDVNVAFMEKLNFDTSTAKKDDMNKDSLVPMDVHDWSLYDHPIFHACMHGEYAAVEAIVVDDNTAEMKTEKDDLTPLMVASCSGHLNIVKLLLEKGASVNSKDREKHTAVYWACQAGHLDILQELSQDGNNLDCGVRDRLLSQAAWQGHLEIVQWLTEKGANVDAKNQHRHTALYCASQRGHLSVVKQLLSHGADIEKGRDKPLNGAALGGHLDVTKWLIEHGADLNAENSYGMTSVTLACQERHFKVVEELVKHKADLDKGTYDTPLLSAVTTGKLDLVKWLLQKGATANASPSTEQTPMYRACVKGRIDMIHELEKYGAGLQHEQTGYLLIAAAEHGHLEVVKWLIQNGVSVNGGTRGGHPALYWVCQDRYHDYIQVAEELVQHGGVLDEAEKDILLTGAARDGREKMVTWLIQQGASVTGVDQDGQTALYHACWERRLGIMLELLEHGADPHQGEKEKPLMAAVRRGHLDVVKELIKHGAHMEIAPKRNSATSEEPNGVQPLDQEPEGNEKPSAKSMPDLAQVLMRHRPDLMAGSVLKPGLKLPEVKDCNEELRKHGPYPERCDIPLITAARKGNKDIVTCLLQNGVSVNAVDKEGVPALSYACDRGHLEVVRELLHHKADVELGGSQKPLIIAVRKGYTEVVKELINEGADLEQNVKDALLVTTAKAGYLEVVKCLLKQGASVNVRDSDGHTILWHVHRIPEFRKRYEPKKFQAVEDFLISQGAPDSD